MFASKVDVFWNTSAALEKLTCGDSASLFTRVVRIGEPRPFCNEREGCSGETLDDRPLNMSELTGHGGGNGGRLSEFEETSFAMVLFCVTAPLGVARTRRACGRCDIADCG